MRVLHITTWREACGIANYAESLVAALEQEGVTSDVASVWQLGRPSLTAAAAASHDLVHIQHELSFFADGRNSPRCDFNALLGELRQRRIPTVVTFHTAPPPPVSLLATGRRALRAGRGLLRVLRRSVGAELFRRRFHLHFNGARGIHGIVHTLRTLELFIGNGFSRGQLTVIPHGVTRRHPAGTWVARDLAKQRLGYPPDSVVLCLFGFISHYKGHDIALAAMRRLPENHHLVMLGGPHPRVTENAQLVALQATLAAEPALASRVRITGFLPDDEVDLYHAAADICLAPYREVELSASGAVTRPLSLGRPVIASRINAFVDIQDDEACLHLCDPDNAAALAESVQTLVADPARRDALVAAGARYVERHLWSAVARRTAAIYTDMVSARSART